jgi:CheY-like chemotaxis protein
MGNAECRMPNAEKCGGGCADAGWTVNEGQSQPVNILYVENHDVFAEQVTRQFLKGHRVTIVPSLSEARVVLSSAEFDLILCDYDLDDGKGDELVRELRGTGKTLPIIAASSHDRGNTALMDAGASAVCGKVAFSGIQGVINEVTWKLMGLPDPGNGLDTLLIQDLFPAEFRLAAATFNCTERPHGWETTFHCETLPNGGDPLHPKLEVTVVTAAKPQIVMGQRWDRQPAYIEREGLWNLTNYYEWGHEAFEDFAVEIVDQNPDGILCWIAGDISLNRQAIPNTHVRVFGWFRHSAETKRSVW